MSLSAAQIVVGTAVKVNDRGRILALGWRRRCLDGYALIKSMGYAWLIFFALMTSVHNMVWLAPFVLLFRHFFVLVNGRKLAVPVFLLQHGSAWFALVSRCLQRTATLYPYTPWALWPWVTLAAGMIVFGNTQKQ